MKLMHELIIPVVSTRVRNRKWTILIIYMKSTKSVSKIFALISINSLWMGDSATDAGFYLLSFGGEGITISYSQMSEADPSGDFSFLGTIGVLSIILFWIGILLSLVNVVMDGLNLFEVFYFRTTTTLSAISGGIMILTPLLWFALFPFKGAIFEELSLQFGFCAILAGPGGFLAICFIQS